MFLILIGILMNIQILSSQQIVNIFLGDKSTPVRLIETGTEDINKSILENGTVNVNSDAVKDLLTYVPEWAETTVDVAEGAGNLSEEMAKECGQCGWYYFCNNRLLTDSNDPWYLASAADPDAKSNTWCCTGR